MPERKDERKNGQDGMNAAASPKRQVETVEAEEMVVVYANNVSTNLSIWDMRLDFGVIERADKEKLSIRQLVQVIMSPQHAKALAILLQEQIKKYEDEFGPLPTQKKAEAEEDDSR